MNREKIISILKGAFDALLGGGLVASLAYLELIDWGGLGGPFLAALAMVAIKAARKYFEPAPPGSPPREALVGGKTMRLFWVLFVLPGVAHAGPTIADTVCRIQFDSGGRIAGGSAVIIQCEGDKALALTAKHCVSGSRSRQGLAALRDGRQCAAQVLATHPNTDLAAITLTVTGELPATAKLAQSSPTPGATLWKVGYPAVEGGQGLDVRTGNLVSMGTWIRTTTYVRSGDSGGGYFTDEGKLVGIITHIAVNPVTMTSDHKGEGVPLPTLTTFVRDT